MSVIEYLLRYVIYALVIMLLGVLFIDIGNRLPGENSEPMLTASELKPIEMLQAIPTKASTETLNPLLEKPEPYKHKLKRFDTFRSKVLLKDSEAAEKQRLLAHLKTIRWIESNLSSSTDNGPEALGERLTMIDFLEEALAWKDNPIRGDVINSIEHTLKINNLVGTKETKQMVAGDKIELFVLLAEQDPDQAKVLLESTKDPQLSKIFQYAIKRLALQNLSEVQR